MDRGVSVAILNWNRADDTKRALSSAIIASGKLKEPSEVVLIDNGSSDDTLPLVKKSFKNKVKIVAHPDNLGFAEGYNYAINSLKYPWVFFMNNDMKLDEQALHELIRVRDASAITPFAVTAHIVTPRNSTECESGLTYTWQKWGRWLLAHSREISDQIKPSLYPGGGSSLINKKRFLQLGGFNSRWFAPYYGEDLFLGLLAWQKGWPTLFAPNANITHYHHSTIKNLSADYRLTMENHIQLALALVIPNEKLFTTLLGLKLRLPKNPNYWQIIHQWPQILKYRNKHGYFSMEKWMSLMKRIHV